MDALHYSTVNEFKRLTDHANAQGIPFYTLQASGLVGNASASAETGRRAGPPTPPPSTRSTESQPARHVDVMASDTGGRAIFDANSPTADLAKVRADFDRYYPWATPGAPRRRQGASDRGGVKRRGLRLRYRQGYRDRPTLERASTAPSHPPPRPGGQPVRDHRHDPGEHPGRRRHLAGSRPLRIPLFKLTILNRNEPSTAIYACSS